MREIRRLQDSQLFLLVLGGMVLGACLVVGARMSTSRFRGDQSVFKVQIVGSDAPLFTLQTYGPSSEHRTEPALAEAAPKVDSRGSHIADFSEGSGEFLLAMGPSWEQERQSREAQRAEIEQAILQRIFEENVDLQTQIFQSANAA
jgi:hypothetical protein